MKIPSLMLVMLLAGCATTGKTPVVEGGEISIQKALGDIGEGFKNLRRNQGEVRTGLVATEATVVLNLRASSRDADKLVIDLGGGAAPPAGRIEAGAKLESESSLEGERGNRITIRFTSSLNYLSPKTVIETCEKIDAKGKKGCTTKTIEGLKMEELVEWAKFVQKAGAGIYSGPIGIKSGAGGPEGKPGAP